MTTTTTIEEIKSQLEKLDPDQEHDNSYSGVDAILTGAGVAVVQYDLLGDYREDVAYFLAAGEVQQVWVNPDGEWLIVSHDADEVLEGLLGFPRNSDRDVELIGIYCGINAALQADLTGDLDAQLPTEPQEGDWEAYEEFCDETEDDPDRLRDDFISGYREARRAIVR